MSYTAFGDTEISKMNFGGGRLVLEPGKHYVSDSDYGGPSPIYLSSGPSWVLVGGAVGAAILVGWYAWKGTT